MCPFLAYELKSVPEEELSEQECLSLISMVLLWQERKQRP